MRLTETPRFQSSCWLTKALVTGSWADLPPGTLGSEYSNFLDVLKELDKTGNGALPSNYNAGRAQAWACLLHFQVLDLILATDFPHLSEASVVTPLTPSFVNKKAARKVLKPLKTWRSQFEAFEKEVENMPEEFALPSSGAELCEDGAPVPLQAESLLPLMAYTPNSEHLGQVLGVQKFAGRSYRSCLDIRGATIQDEQIFTDIIARYDAAAALAATDSTRPHSIITAPAPSSDIGLVCPSGSNSGPLGWAHFKSIITNAFASRSRKPPTPAITEDQPTGSYIISTTANLQAENIAAPTVITPNESPSTFHAASLETPEDPLITSIAVPETTQNADETFSDDPLSPVPESDDEGAMDVDGSGVEETGGARRQSAQTKAPATVFVAADTTHPASTQAKRKSAAATAPERQEKRRKVTSDNMGCYHSMEVEDVPLGLDSEWVDPDRPDYWTRDLRDVAPIERADKTQHVTALLPDGRTERTFEYLGHKVSQQVEYRLIHDRSDGDPMVPPTENDSHLCSLQLSQWQAMSDEERVKLWGTGTDLFIYGLKPGNKIDDIRKQITKDHRLDAPVEVQVQGLRVPPEDPGDVDANVDYTTILRTTTLQTILDEAEKANGLVLNALKLPSGQILHNNPLMGSGFDLELVAYRQTKQA
ncbi:hypothetical protein C8F04DRAFT_1363282 [Mycena alexandri]|uniref:Uncharacterized protein n=1 Tax=Mycena alexandri TaxID=1745969 RepID=A0AAD6WJY1_9AGAR|nr:hypothetical protein C8F04DRAFT_1363282 [Mycena alexandri]